MTEEPQPGALLVTAGFGSDPGLSRVHGARYFKEGRITQLPATHTGRVLYKPAGAYLNTSYRGGPCFLKEGKSHLLIGIVSLGTDQEMSCTSTYFHRDWLRAELEVLP